MPTISITNQVTSQALRGQNVKITVDLTTQSAEFAQLQVGQLASCNGNPTCYVYSIDAFGNTFEVAPRQLDFSVGTNGYVESNIDIDVTI